MGVRLFIYAVCAALNVPFFDHSLNAFACGVSAAFIIAELSTAWARKAARSHHLAENTQ